LWAVMMVPAAIQKGGPAISLQYSLGHEFASRKLCCEVKTRTDCVSVYSMEVTGNLCRRLEAR
jgi:hypothetical protein